MSKSTEKSHAWYILCIYALPKQNKLNRKRHRHCHGMHGQYNLPESRIFRFSYQQMLGLQGGEAPLNPLNPAGGLGSPQTPGAIGYPLSFTNYLLHQKKTRTLCTMCTMQNIDENSFKSTNIILWH